MGLSGALLGLVHSACAPVDRPSEPEIPALPGRVTITATPTSLTPNWNLTLPGGVRVSGTGDTTIFNASVGTYSLTWDPAAGYRSPRPNPCAEVLISAGMVSFDGVYEPTSVPTSPVGSVMVQPTPALLDAPWALSGPNAYSVAGTGIASLSDLEVGTYTLSWNSVAGWSTPQPSQQTQTLAENQTITFSATYVEAAGSTTGTVVVEPLREGLGAPWTLNGPGGFTTSGSSLVLLSGRATGSYTVTWHDAAGWISPSPSQQTKTLSANGTITFTGTYVRDSDPAGAPQINSVSGNPAHGAQLVLAGDSFGAHSMDVEWTGTWLENQPDGTNPDTKPNWDHLFSGYKVVDQVTSTRSWSGSKSIVTNTDKADLRCGTDGCFESTLQYVHPSTFDRIYATWWMYFDPITVDPSAETQWKFIRINSNWTGWSDSRQSILTPVNDIQSDVYWPLYMNTAGTIARSALDYNCNQDCSPWYECWRLGSPIGYAKNGDTGRQTWVDRNTGQVQTYGPSLRSWCRVEIWAHSGTLGNFDGSMRVTVMKPGVGILTGYDWQNLKILDPAPCRNPTLPWKTIIFQNMFDSNGSAPAVEKARFYFDDIYLQFGTQARVELGDRSRYQDCSRLEIQEPTSWSSSSISIRLNRGAFPAGSTAYLFVVREDGTASAGSAVALQ
jgi:hypothetical protein